MTVKNKVKVSQNVVRADTKYWHVFFRFPYSNPKITGKYLFFSKLKKELEKIAIEEIENNNFFQAKINTDEHKKGDEYVLCLYYSDDSRKYELAKKYNDNKEIKYRYWKSNGDTIKGKYSEEFLDKLSDEERTKWVNKRLR